MRLDTALICENGHVITNFATSVGSERVTKFCGTCGAKTISACPSCRGPIPGGRSTFSEIPRPAFCAHCGKPYPWTSRAVDAALALMEHSEALSPEEREALRKDIPELVRDTAMTTVAAARTKRLLGKAGTEIAAGVRTVLTDVLVEGAKRILLGTL